VDPWWKQLPALLDKLAARWQLVVGDPVGRGNTSLASTAASKTAARRS
jgi:streptomycin 6-kinase